MITAKEFKYMTGRLPIQDDLGRCNCKKAGELGHWSCGICIHNKPFFECQPCTTQRVEKHGTG